ncbi:hypothetical protein M3J09_010500 [Ascochyta lentis]
MPNGAVPEPLFNVALTASPPTPVTEAFIAYCMQTVRQARLVT